MTSKNIVEMLRLITQVVDTEGTWWEKRDTIQAECDEDSAAKLHEFATWFVAFNDNEKGN